MRTAGYRHVLGHVDARRALLLGFAFRVPLFASNLVLMLHVVDGLGRSYGEAGVLVTVYTLALGVSGPWRGRALDARGLRATMAPLVVVQLVLWSIAPWVAYELLLVAVLVAGLTMLPAFSMVRQAMMAAVGEEHHQAALSLDSLTTEVGAMAGPLLGIWAAQQLGTDVALLLTQLVAAAAAVLLWLADPPLRAAGDGHGSGPRISTRSWLGPTAVVTLGGGLAAAVVLHGTDIGIVAALRQMGHEPWIGWVVAVWALGSAVGALGYGALHREAPLFLLLALLAVTTLPVALAPEPVSMAALLFVCGVFCAPTLTACTATLARVVPAGAMGEAMGWQVTAFTLGGAVGAPLAGFAIDHAGWQAAFVVTALVALAGAITGLLLGRTAPTHEARRVEA